MGRGASPGLGSPLCTVTVVVETGRREPVAYAELRARGAEYKPLWDRYKLRGPDNVRNVVEQAESKIREVLRGGG